MNRLGLLADQSGLRLLAARVEGNLLAAAQEIEKLHILYGAGRIEDEQILAAVCDCARYDVFDLTTAMLEGHTLRTLRILYGLEGEGVAPPVVLWAITRELRSLAVVQRDTTRGLPMDGVLARLADIRQAQGGIRQSRQTARPGRCAGCHPVMLSGRSGSQRAGAGESLARSVRCLPPHSHFPLISYWNGYRHENRQTRQHGIDRRGRRGSARTARDSGE